jgi:hypothetical protein
MLTLTLPDLLAVQALAKPNWLWLEVPENSDSPWLQRQVPAVWRSEGRMAVQRAIGRAADMPPGLLLREAGT